MHPDLAGLPMTIIYPHTAAAWASQQIICVVDERGERSGGSVAPS